MLEVILVRHAQTNSNIRNTFVGSTDVYLNERGIRQAQTLGRNLSRENIDTVYVSTLTRAIQTATEINRYQKMKKQLNKVSDLAERKFGLWEDLTAEEIQKKYPEQYEEWQQNFIDYQIPRGESSRDFYDRCVHTLTHILKRHKEGKIMIVTHLGNVRAMTAHLLGLPVESSWKFTVKNAGIVRFGIEDDGFTTLLTYNEI